MIADDSIADGPLGALCWRNWKEAEPDAPPAFEATLYSDALFTGGPALTDIGPYKLFNIIAIRNGELGEALVVRWSSHLAEPTYALTAANKKQTDSWLGMDLHEEIAALLALLLGVRVRSGGITREFRDTDGPAGKPVAFGHVRPTWQRPERPVLPGIAGARRYLGGIPDLLRRLPTLTAAESVALLRAARLYQMAIWVADEDPELAWLQLVSAAEVAAEHWRGHLLDPTDVLDTSMPELVARLRDKGGEDLVSEVAEMLAKLTKSTARFLDFLLAFMPDPPTERCEEYFQVPWSQLKKRLGLIYGYRSDRLHGGIPFPAVMNQPPHVLPESGRPCERPFGIASLNYTSQWPASELPMYLWTFEHIVRGALSRWYTEGLGPKES